MGGGHRQSLVPLGPPALYGLLLRLLKNHLRKVRPIPKPGLYEEKCLPFGGERGALSLRFEAAEDFTHLKEKTLK